MDNSGLKNNSLQKESKWNLKKVDSNKWNGIIENQNKLLTIRDEEVKQKNPKATMLQEIKVYDIRESKVFESTQKCRLFRNCVPFASDMHKNMKIQKWEMTNNENREIIEEEMNLKNKKNVILQDNKEMQLKSNSIVNSQQIYLNMSKNTMDHCFENKIAKEQNEIMNQRFTQENLKITKEDLNTGENKEEMFIHRSTLKGNEMVHEIIKQDKICISTKMKIQRTIIEVPKEGEDTKMARIEIVNSKKIFMDEKDSQNKNLENYEFCMTSKINLESSDVRLIGREMIGKKIFEELNQTTSEPNKNISYKKCGFDHDKYTVRKEVLKEEIKFEEGVKIKIKDNKKIRIITDDDSEEKIDSTEKINTDFLKENQIIMSNIPANIVQSSMNLLKLPNKTFRMISNTFKGILYHSCFE